MTVKKNISSLFNLVVSHYLASAICFLVLAVMLLFASDVFTGHYFQPRLLAMTHMAALGWGTLVIFGASYQFLQFILETDLFSRKIAWASYVLFLPGLIMLVTAFWVFDPGIYMQAGSLLLLTSILLFAANIFFTVRKNKEASVHEEFIVTSCWWLAFTAVLGTLLVFNFRFAFLPEDHLHFLRLHAHMGVAGWFLLLIIGVSTKLVPMFLVSRYQNNKLLSWSYYLVNAALISFLVDTYMFGINYKTFFSVILAAGGIGSYLFFLYKCFLTRGRSPMDIPMLNTALSFILLTLAVLILPRLIHHYLKNDPLSVKYSVLYGCMLFMGWITALILGQTFKTLSFIVRAERYGHFTGKEQTPLPVNLVKNTLLKIQSVAFFAFCLTFFTGYFFSLVVLMKAGLFCLLVTAVLYVVNVAVVLMHRTKTVGYD